jgi:hypothetical protein
MDTDRLDHLARTCSRLLSRRGFAWLLGLAAVASPDLAAAKRIGRKKKKKIKRNAFGCVNVGNVCRRADQCCSGICGGGKCRAHDATTCQVGETFQACGGADVACVSSSDVAGRCVTTSGSGAFCAANVQCFACQQDADCVDLCGEGAACFPCQSKCGEEAGGMACASVNEDGCVK